MTTDIVSLFQSFIPICMMGIANLMIKGDDKSNTILFKSDLTEVPIWTADDEAKFELLMKTFSITFS